ncbi:MAG: hypothetical protein DRP97_02935 [Candidatus Latescibacterota bacterium]|nr:MAG: hypothetical protein DRP97_02935 [Candidatus Latescibacterota bacterium]
MQKSKKEKVKQLSFRLPETVTKMLDEAHWELRKSRVDIVQEALIEYFAKHNVGDSPPIEDESENAES